MFPKSSNGWSYLAGILDTSSSLVLRKHKRSKRNYYRSTIHVKSQELAMLQWLQNFTGVGYIRNHGWYVTRKTDVERLLIEISPYIRFKKLEISILLRLAEYKSGHPIAEVLGERLYQQMCEIKR